MARKYCPDSQFMELLTHGRAPERERGRVRPDLLSLSSPPVHHPARSKLIILKTTTPDSGHAVQPPMCPNNIIEPNTFITGDRILMSHDVTVSNLSCWYNDMAINCNRMF